MSEPSCYAAPTSQSGNVWALHLHEFDWVPMHDPSTEAPDGDRSVPLRGVVEPLSGGQESWHAGTREISRFVFVPRLLGGIALFRITDLLCSFLEEGLPILKFPMYTIVAGCLLEQ